MLDSTQDLGEITKPGHPTYDILVKNFSIQGIVMMSIALILALFFIYYFTGKALNSLADLTKKIKAVNEKNLHETVAVKKTSAEVAQLMQAYNIHLEEAFAI